MSAMAGPAWSSEPPHWLNGGEEVGGGWKESSADRPESIQTLTTTHLLGGITREEEDGQKATSEWHVPNVLNSRPSTKRSASPACVLLFFITHSAIFLPPPPPFTILVASGRFQRHYWNVDTEDDVTKLSRTGRGAEIIGGVRETRLGWGGGWGGEVFGIFFSAGVQVCWLKRVTAEGLDLDATLGAASLSVCLATTPPEQDDVIQRDLWAFLIKRQNHGGKPNYAARVWTGQGATPLLGFFWGGKHVGPASARFFKMNIFPSCLSIKTKCPQNVFIYFIDFEARESPQTKAVYNQINDGCIPPSYFGVSGTLRAGSQLTETLE